MFGMSRRWYIYGTLPKLILILCWRAIVCGRDVVQDITGGTCNHFVSLTSRDYTALFSYACTTGLQLACGVLWVITWRSGINGQGRSEGVGWRGARETNKEETNHASLFMRTISVFGHTCKRHVTRWLWTLVDLCNPLEVHMRQQAGIRRNTMTV